MVGPVYGTAKPEQQQLAAVHSAVVDTRQYSSTAVVPYAAPYKDYVLDQYLHHCAHYLPKYCTYHAAARLDNYWDKLGLHYIQYMVYQYYLKMSGFCYTIKKTRADTSLQSTTTTPIAKS